VRRDTTAMEVPNIMVADSPKRSIKNPDTTGPMIRPSDPIAPIHPIHVPYIKNIHEQEKTRSERKERKKSEHKGETYLWLRSQHFRKHRHNDSLKETIN
jgi:hypothetical protein